MTRNPLAPTRRVSAAAAALALAFACSGCAWQTYAVTRSTRELTGAKARLHVIVPVVSGLWVYRVIEFIPLADLVGARVPAERVRYLHERIAAELRDLPTAPAVDTPAPAVPGAPPDAGDGTVQILVVDGFLDDYETGSRAMRIAELGFNHIAVTVRVRLRDKASGRLLGAASVTAEDDSASGTTSAAIEHAAERIRAFVETGYAR
jgi:hypothetical protein